MTRTEIAIALMRLLLLEEGLVAGFTLFTMRCVARLNVVDEFPDGYVSEVWVAIEHDKVLHNLIVSLFFAF